MGCGSCGSRTADGKPSGCKSNGGCSTGGCNRLNVHDWLADMPAYDGLRPYPILEISFNKGSRKDFYRNPGNFLYEKGDWVAVEGTGGFDVGTVSLTGELVKLQMKKRGVDEKAELKKMLRPAQEDDLKIYHEQKAREPEILVQCRAIARQHKLDMKIAVAEVQADGRKVTVYYTAEQRVDFREILRIYATEFRARVEMRQIGARQESGKVGGIGSCGRELCCSTWLTDFKAVNTGAARYQNLSINQVKLAGQCGRLKCCLNYELDTYMDALKAFPSGAEKLEVGKGMAFLQKKDIFRNLMWYTLPGSSRQYPLALERVHEIMAMNKEGLRPDELGAVVIEKPTEGDGGVGESSFVNDVGQVSLRALERNNKKQKKAKKDASRQQGAPQKEGVAVAKKPEAGRQATATKAPQQPRKEAQSQQPRPPRPEGVRPQQPQRPRGEKKEPKSE